MRIPTCINETEGCEKRGRHTTCEVSRRQRGCAKCGATPDAGMRERVANGDADICEPCYKFEYNLS